MKTPTTKHLLAGQNRLNLLRVAREHKAAGLNWREIGALLGTDWQKLRRWDLRVASIPTALLTAEDLTPGWRFSGRKPVHSAGTCNQCGREKTVVAVRSTDKPGHHLKGSLRCYCAVCGPVPVVELTLGAVGGEWVRDEDVIQPKTPAAKP